MSSRSGTGVPSTASTMIARSVSLISCFTGAALSSDTDIAVTIACVTRGWRSSARRRAAQHVGDAVGGRVAARRPLVEALAERRAWSASAASRSWSFDV